MNEELELAKVSLKNANDYADIKSNPVVESVLMPIVKAVPVIGDMIDSSMNKVIEEFQEKKENEFNEDKNIWKKIYSEIPDFDPFYELIEEKNIYFKELMLNGKVENNDILLNSVTHKIDNAIKDVLKNCEDRNIKEWAYLKNSIKSHNKLYNIQ